MSANQTYLIVGINNKRVIGRNNDIPWHVSEDLKLFKKLTLGGTLIMGRNTYESIGKPLPKRLNLVVSRTMSPQKGLEVFASVQEALDYASQQGRKIFFIGGQSIYAEALKLVDNLYVSKIDNDCDGDVFFPEYDQSNWEEIEQQKYEKFTWFHYRRIQ